MISRCDDGTRSWCETSGIVTPEFYVEEEELSLLVLISLLMMYHCGLSDSFLFCMFPEEEKSILST